MKKFKNLALATFCFCFLAFGVNAQILDDDEPFAPQNDSAWSDDDTEANEALFNELFSDRPETERDITKKKTFNDAMDDAADVLKRAGATQPVADVSQEEPELAPISGEVYIGLTKGSFRISKDTVGKTTCSFSITLKSTVNRKIRVLALNLNFVSYHPFAFIFTNIPEYGAQEKFINTRGDICYQLSGIPDIDIHKCKMYGATGKECTSRIKWDESITKPTTPTQNDEEDI